MTVRELIKELSEVDNDVMDYEVWIVSQYQLSKDLKFEGKSKVSKVPNFVNVELSRLYIESYGSSK